ncbi:MFS transporter [Pseudomonas sp. NPDC089743]|uniref:MFS transporter n=1 Tax=Pseudomonas sp. NPDC089743 TaxID=3364471 RepID=UPI00380FCF2C
MAILSALVGSTAPSPLYALYQDNLGFSSTTLTMLFAVYAIGVLLALGLLGTLSDRLADRRLVLVPALFVVAAGSLVFAVSTELTGLFMGRFLAGIGTGALTGSANAALVGFDAQDRKRHAAVLATISFTCGAALGPVLSSLALGLGFYPTLSPFILNASLAIVTAIGLCRLAWNDTAAQPLSKPAGSEAPRTALRQQMQGNWPAFTRISFILVVAWTVGSVFVALGPSMLLSTMSSASSGSHASAGLLVTAFQAIAGLTQFVCRRVNAAHAMRYGGALLFMAWLGCLAALYLHQPLVFVVFTVLAGVGYGATFVGAMGIFTTLAPSAHRAALGSLFYLAGYLGSALGIIAMGVAVDLLGLVRASAVMLAVVGAALAWLLPWNLEPRRPAG